jgi:hypothetical protein
MNRSESIIELAKALAKAQAELGNPKKNTDNTYFKSRYADLSEVINVSKPVLSAHGLSIIQLLSFKDNQVCCETIMLHVSGEFISETLCLPVAKYDSQSIGSGGSYARRYSWAAICGIAQEDDDGNIATGNGEKLKSDKKPPLTAEEFIRVTSDTIDEISGEITKMRWKSGIKSGKTTADNAIAAISTRNALTDEQITIIRSWENVNVG